MIVNIKEKSLFSSSSSLTTVSKLRLVIGHRVVPIGTSHLWLLRVRTPHSSASVHLPLLFGTRCGIVTGFCLHIIWVKALGQVVQSLLRMGAFELAPLSSLGCYSRLFFIMKALGVVAPSIKSLDFVRKIHHPEGSVSAFSDASVFRIVFFGSWRSAKFFQLLALCLGLSTAPQVFMRVMAPVRSFLHSLGFGFGLICTAG